MTVSGAPKLILHCGMQKTGSTSFQTFVRQNAAQLLPRVTFLTSEERSVTRQLGRYVGNFARGANLRRSRGLREKLQELASAVRASNGTCVVSNENFCGTAPGREKQVAPYASLPNIIGMFEEELGDFEPEYVFYTRDVASWHKSNHSQLVRTDRYRRSFEGYLKHENPFEDWSWITSRLDGVVPSARLHVFRLEDEKDRTRPGQQLLRLAGLGADEIKRMTPLENMLNERLTSGALEFMMYLNRLDLEKEAWLQVSRQVRMHQRLFVDEQTEAG